MAATVMSSCASSAGRPLRVAALLLGVLVAPLAAQADFAEAYRQAETLRLGGEAQDEQVRDAYARALRAFLQMPRDDADFASWLPSGSFAAFLATDYSMAADLFEQSMAAGHRDAFHAEYLLRSQLAAGKIDAVLLSARELWPAFDGAVGRVLIEEGGLASGGGYAAADRRLRAGDTELGLWVFELPRRLRPDDPVALGNWALALRYVGREVESEGAYRRALALAADDSILWNDLGLLYKGMGRLQEAEKALRRSWQLEGEPHTGPATTNLAALGRPVLAEPAAALAVVLRERPDAGLARRLYLEELAAAPSSSAKTPRQGDTTGR